MTQNQRPPSSQPGDHADQGVIDEMLERSGHESNRKRLKNDKSSNQETAKNSSSFRDAQARLLRMNAGMSRLLRKSGSALRTQSGTTG